MKFVRLFFAFVIAFAASLPAKASIDTFYMGVSAQAHSMDFKGSHTDNLSPQLTVYGGMNLTEHLSAEVGYESANISTSILTPGHTSVVTPPTARAQKTITRFPAIFKSTAKLRGGYIDIIGLYPPSSVSEIQFLVGVGISMSKGTFEHHVLQLGSISATTIQKFKERKNMLRLTGGVQYMFDESVGVRATVRWINTGKMKAFGNTTGYGLGLIWLF